MPGFLFKLLGPPGMTPRSMTDEQRRIMGEHAAYWREMLAAGHAIAYGPVDDGGAGFGVGIVRADDADHAQQLADLDPAVQSGAGFSTEVLPMLALVTADGDDRPA